MLLLRSDGVRSDEEFFEVLGGRGEIKTADEGGADDENIRDTKGLSALYRYSLLKMFDCIEVCTKKKMKINTEVFRATIIDVNTSNHPNN